MRGSDLGARIRFGVQVEIYLDRFDRLRRSEFANFRRRWRQILIWQVWSQGTRCCRVWWWNELSAMLSPLFNTPPCFVSWCFYGGNLLHKALSRSGGIYGIDDAPSRENSLIWNAAIQKVSRRDKWFWNSRLWNVSGAPIKITQIKVLP
jgi:hypothetical protein